MELNGADPAKESIPDRNEYAPQAGTTMTDNPINAEYVVKKVQEKSGDFTVHIFKDIYRGDPDLDPARSLRAAVKDAIQRGLIFHFASRLYSTADEVTRARREHGLKRNRQEGWKHWRR